jgi:predicted nucleic acid-binding protein
MLGSKCAPGLNLRRLWIPQPTERHADLLGEFLALPGVHGNLVPDAHVAALAVEHGLTLCSTDGDFARFQGLRWLNPIATWELLDRSFI